MEAACSDAVEALAALGLESLPTEAFAAWLHGDMAFDGDALSDGSAPLDAAHDALEALLEAAALNGEDGTRPFWEALASICPGAVRALMMSLYRTVVRGKEANAPDEPPARAAVKAAQVYWALLAYPAASAYGIFDGALVRAVVAFSMHYFELVRSAAAPQPKARAHTRPRASRPRIDASGAEDSQSGPRRRNSSRHRRTSQQQGATSAAGGDDQELGGSAEDALDADAEVEPSDDEDSSIAGGGGEVARAGHKRRGLFVAANAKPASSPDSSAVGAAVAGLLASAARGIAAFDLRVQPELLACCSDLFVGAVLLPDHTLTERYQSGTGASQLELAARILLSLLRPGHGAPLTTARLAMKRLKPLLMFGTPHASRAPALVAAATALEDAGDDTDAPLAARPPPPLPDPRAVRARALFLVRCAVTDVECEGVGTVVSNAVAAAVVTSPALAASSIVPTPQPVLDRLPAVAALMQVRCYSCWAPHFLPSTSGYSFCSTCASQLWRAGQRCADTVLKSSSRCVRCSRTRCAAPFCASWSSLAALPRSPTAPSPSRLRQDCLERPLAAPEGRPASPLFPGVADAAQVAAPVTRPRFPRSCTNCGVPRRAMRASRLKAMARRRSTMPVRLGI